MRKLSFSLVAFLTIIPHCAAQTATKDISYVLAVGKVHGNEYTNDYFALTLAAPNGRFQTASVVNKEEGRARLVDAFSTSSRFEDLYTFAVLADTLAKYPQLQSKEHYLRSLRHQLEKEGLETIHEEFPIQVSGVSFTGAVMKEKDEQGRSHVRGMYSTFVNGYILSLDVTAPSEARLQELLSTAIKFRHK